MARIAKSQNNGDITTLAALAAKFGVSVKTVQMWRRKGAPVDKIGGRYNTEKIKAWKAGNVRETAEYPGSFDGEDEIGEKTDLVYSAERAKKVKADRLIQEAKYQEMMGELIPRKDVEERDIQRIAVVKSRLLALPRRLAQEMVGLNATQMEVMMKTRFRELLEQFASM